MNILLADDSITIQRVVSELFEDSAHHVDGFTNGQEALAAAEVSLPDLVIADVHMPGATGYDVARRIKSLSRAVPVLLLVGTFEPFSESEAEACGADGHLMKPFDTEELRQRVEDLTGGTSPSPGEGEPEAPAPEPAPDDEAAAETGPDLPEGDDTVADQAETGRPASDAATTEGLLDDRDVERIARRVVELISDDVVRELARDVVPELAEAAVQRRIAELERDVD